MRGKFYKSRNVDMPTMLWFPEVLDLPENYDKWLNNPNNSVNYKYKHQLFEYFDLTIFPNKIYFYKTNLYNENNFHQKIKIFVTLINLLISKI